METVQSNILKHLQCCVEYLEQFAGCERFKSLYLYSSLAAKGAIQNVWSYRRARRLQFVKTVTFAECESFKNE